LNQTSEKRNTGVESGPNRKMDPTGVLRKGNNVKWGGLTRRYIAAKKAREEGIK